MARMMRMYRALERVLVPGAMTLAILGVSLNDVSSYVKGLEFRALMAQVLAQVASGVTDAVIQTFVYASFGVLQ